jgi:hypothetical protein
MIPLLMLAAGLLAQNEAKHQSVKAQAKETTKEKRRQLGFQQDASTQLHKEMDAYGATAREGQDAAATDRLRATSDGAADDAVQLFEGAGAAPGSTMAVRDSAGRHGAAGAQLNGGRIGANERRRLGLDIGANIAGIRQRSQRSLGLLPERLERASHHGEGLNTVGGLMASYGYGGVMDGAKNSGYNSGTKAAKNGRPKYWDEVYEMPTVYDKSSPGADDLYGRHSNQA